MKKKILALIACLSVLISIGLYFIVTGLSNTDEPFEIVNNPIPTATPKPNIQEVVKPTQPPVSDKEFDFEFDNYVIVEKTEEDYLPEVDMSDIRQGVDAVSNSYDFSNGFVVMASDILTLYSVGLDRITLVSPDSSKVDIKEWDPIENNVNSVLNYFLEFHGLSYYITNRLEELPITSAWNKDEGVIGWMDYYGGELKADALYYNPFESNGFYLLCDIDIETNYGIAQYIEVYYKYTDTFHAHAVILCDRDRILSVSVESKNREDLKDYVLEATSKCVGLVK